MELKKNISVNEIKNLAVDNTEFALFKTSILSSDKKCPECKDKVDGLNEFNRNDSGEESSDSSGLGYLPQSTNSAASGQGDEKRNSISDQRNISSDETNNFQITEPKDIYKSTDRTSIPIKKSILKTPTKSTKRSGLGIQWEEDVKVKLGDESKRGSSFQKLLEGGMNRPKRIGELIENLILGKELTLGLMDHEDKFIKHPQHELTLDQQVKLEILKQKVKKENEDYLMKHPEISILLKLIYRKLCVHRPKDPNRFVAEYVHHLNKHRDELIHHEVDVPFDIPDPPHEPSESLSIGETFESKLKFVKRLVENCAEIAFCGPAYLAVMSILDSVLSAVVASDSEVSVEERRSAESAVTSLILSILENVKLARTHSSEVVVDEILNDVLKHISPTVSLDKSRYFTVRGSVERFILSLVEGSFDKAIK